MTLGQTSRSPLCSFFFKVFVGKHSDKGDYHTEMNTVLFMEWFNRLLGVLEQPSVIILDNASYHNAITEDSKAPTMKDRKCVLQDWLTSNRIPFAANLTKPALYSIIQKNKPAKIYETDVRAQLAGHVVLRTPPRQCELNAIELIWAQVKGDVARRNTGMKLKEVLQLTRSAIGRITKDDWESVVCHTKKVEIQHWETDGLMEAIEPMVIDLDSSDESDTDDEANHSDE